VAGAPDSRDVPDRLPGIKIYPAHNIGYFGNPESVLRDADVELPFWLGAVPLPGVGIESGGDVKGCLSLPSSVHGENRFARAT